VTSMRALAARREPERTLVRIFNPDQTTDGFTAPHTVVQVCTDDMPFLVDSVTAAISGAGHLVDLIIHPQVAVTRSQDGTLEQIQTIKTVGQEAKTESWMLVAVDRTCEAGRAHLSDLLYKELGDVRDAVTDWSSMREHCEEFARELTIGSHSIVESGEVEA